MNAFRNETDSASNSTIKPRHHYLVQKLIRKKTKLTAISGMKSGLVQEMKFSSFAEMNLIEFLSQIEPLD